MHRSRLMSIMQAASGCRLSWKYCIEETDITKADELAKVNNENEDNAIFKEESKLATDDTSEQTEISKSLGDQIYAYFCATILENTIAEMQIMEQYQNKLRIEQVKIDTSVLKGKKYGVKQPLAKEGDGLTQMDFGNVGEQDGRKIKKLYADRNYITEVIRSLYKELSLRKSFTSLTNSVNEMLARNSYLVSLKYDEKNNKMRAKELSKQLRQQRNRFKIESYEKDIMIYKLQIKIKDIKQLISICDRYVDNWQGSRTEQHSQVLSIAEDKRSKAVESFKQKYNQEYRAHSELETYLNGVIHDTCEKIDEQIDKYEKDTEAIDLKIKMKMYEYLSMHDDRIRLEETLKERDNFIKKWIQIKEERAKSHIYCETMHKSACTVQAWWRGISVRRSRRRQFGRIELRQEN